MAESFGGPRDRFGGDAPEVEETFAELSATAQRALGDRAWPMLVCYRVRLGVK